MPQTLSHPLIDTKMCRAGSIAAFKARAATVVCLLLLAACGKADDRAQASDLSANELYNQIEDARVSQPEQESRGPRLDSLAERDIPAGFTAGAHCSLRQSDRLLLVSNTSGGLARIDGRVTRLRIGGPVGISGGFFVADGASVSIGRAVRAPGQANMSEGPATVSIGGAPDRPIEKIEADWACI